MNKITRTLLCTSILAASVLGAASCGEESPLKAIAKDDIKIGLICLHDQSSTYDKNFIDSMNDAVAQLGLKSSQLVVKTNIAESEDCYNTAAELADGGCNIIFADSFGHESHLLRAAKEFPAVRFAHATGTTAHTNKQPNFYNAFANIYQGRYLAGVAGGLKLKDMIEKGTLPASSKKDGDNYRLGYVGAFPYAEVKSGYTSWFLGVQSVVPNVVMDVTFTGSWYDPVAEGAGATTLVTRGAALISQHADSMGSPDVCKANGIPNVSYNGSTESTCSGSFIVSSKIDWAPYFKFLVNSAIENKQIPFDFTGTLADGSVKLTEFGAAAAAGTEAKVNEVKAKLQSGQLKVFDTNKFTVKGQKLTSYKADVDDDGTFTPETEVIKDGYFHESEYRSAPYFDINIDGINLLN